MDLLFRRKKTPNKKADNEMYDENKNQELQGQVESLQTEMQRLNKRLVSMAAKVQKSSSSAPGVNESSKPTSLGTNSMNQSHLMRRAPPMRNQLLPRSEGRRNIFVRQLSDDGFGLPPLAENQEPPMSEVVIDKESSAPSAKTSQKYFSIDLAKKYSPASTDSVASSKAEGEIFYRNGKKIRRVVRMVRPSLPSDPSPPDDMIGSPSVRSRVQNLKRSSFTSTASSGSGAAAAAQVVQGGHVKAMKDKFAILNASNKSPDEFSDKKSVVSKSPSVSSSKHPPRFYDMSDPPGVRYNEEKKQFVDRQTGKRKVEAKDLRFFVNQGRPIKPELDAKEIDLERSTKQHIAKVVAASTNMSHRKGKDEVIKTTTKPKSLPQHLTRQVPAARHQKRNEPAILLKTGTTNKSGAVSKTKSSWNPSPPVKSSETPLKQLKPDSLLDQIRSHDGKLKKIDQEEKKPNKISVRNVSPLLPKSHVVSSHPNGGRTVKSNQNSVQSGPSLSLLDQIRQQDVNLKKVSSDTKENKTPKMSDPTNDILAGIRAGVHLKKVDRSTLQPPKKQETHMSLLLAKIQERKAECLRREQQANSTGDEIDW